ncbi:MAG: hypothetical protein E7628_01425 [Ruminococcaceae bacterium]|nr:hypothetical protein [Oscillospiraceae bacterium]
MKKQVKIIVSVLAILCALTVTVIAAYDSSEDPLISFSYLNDIFKKEILAEVDARFEELRSGIDDYLDNLELPEATVPSDPDDEPSGSASAAWDIVEITTGQSIYAVSTCEFLIRSGSAVCIAPDAKQGIADLTGSEIFNGESIPMDRLCMIPRGDGRGIKATHQSVYVMIRGEYTIVDN